MYVTPVTGANSLLILSKVATLKVSHRITKIIEIEDAGDGKDRAASANMWKEAERILMNTLPEIVDLGGGKVTRRRPLMPLPDAPINKGVPGITNAVSKTQKATPTGGATFVKGADNW